MLSWAQLHSKSLYLLSSVWVVNGRDDKLWREELRRLQNGPDVCFPGVSVLASQRCAVSRVGIQDICLGVDFKRAKIGAP